MARKKPGGANPSPGPTIADIVNLHDPDLHTQSLARRDDKDLPFDVARMPPNAPVMVDTNFYIRRLQGKLPADISVFVTSRRILHSGIACHELAISAGILDPVHAKTAQNRAALTRVLSSISDSDIVAPSAEAWIES